MLALSLYWLVFKYSPLDSLDLTETKRVPAFVEFSLARWDVCLSNHCENGSTSYRCLQLFTPSGYFEMHNPDSAGDSPSPRKMAYPAIIPRRGNVCNQSSETMSALSSVTCSTLSNNPLLADEYHSLTQAHAISVSSTAGSQQPPNSLNIHTQSTMQPQILPLSGAQMKKKSGFQITSVTPAQITVSTNNSITEDTESCDDLDESHTEDLSSSEIMDIPLSRTDKGGPQRSYSEETLNNFPEAETPGAMSPNQPPLHHSLTHPQGIVTNGSAHHLHQQDPHDHHHIHANLASSASISAQSVFPALTTVSTSVQKMPLNVGGLLENSFASTTGLMGQPSPASVPGATAEVFSAVSGATICNVSSSNVNNISTLNSACVPVVGGISTSISNVVPFTGLMNSSSSQNMNMVQQHQQSGTTGASVSGVLGINNSGLTGVPGAGQPMTTGNTVPVSHTQQQQHPVTTSSRFRVVKLDSNSEPFKKGRWTCTEYYDKETASSTFASASTSTVPSEIPVNQVVETVRQRTENTVAGSERDCLSLSSSSVSSSVSTLSHYSESVGSGEMGGPSILQQTFQQSQDYTPVAPLSAHNVKNSTAPSPPVSMQQQQTSTNLGTLTSTMPPSSAVSQQQQLSYVQTHPAQCVSQQLMGYSHAQQSALPAQVALGHIPLNQACTQSSDYSQTQLQTSCPGSSQSTTLQTGCMPPASVSGNSQFMIAAQQPVGKAPTSVTQPLPLGLLQSQPQQTSSPQMVQAPVGVMPQTVPAMLPGLLQKPKGHQLPIEQQPVSTQGMTPHSSVITNLLSNVPPNPANIALSGVVQNGTKDNGVHSSASTLCATLPTLTATQLEGAQRLLLQHQSLLSLPMLAAGECASQTGTSLATEGSVGVNALKSSASLLKNLPVDGEDDGSSGASVVAIDNKIEQAMDLVKSHLMYAVREEVEVLKEQIKELVERNSQLEQENNLLKNLASPEQLAQFQAQVQSGSPPASIQGSQQPAPSVQLASQTSGPSA
ncbi:TSC22 domain family protein 1 isoform X1 [Alosa sapidissima]|uniref:TSC22 domain family protein 1 isoform X1 n=1 Tax=Alosa sapidissima TaxID=34773 RepID=UPI001C09ED1B|nr:TSC22 domain family protein 1 isoform X1 [Alosa sapidissima]